MNLEALGNGPAGYCGRGGWREGTGLVDHQVSEAHLRTRTQVLNANISQGTALSAGLSTSLSGGQLED